MGAKLDLYTLGGCGGFGMNATILAVGGDAAIRAARKLYDYNEVVPRLTALRVGAKLGDHKTAEYLISHGADINASDRVGMTPLHVAVLSGGRQVTQVLLDLTQAMRPPAGGPM